MEAHHFIDPEAIYDAHPDGMGEIPAEGTPVHTSISSSGIRTEAELRREVGRFGRIRKEVDSFRDQGLSVGVKLSALHIDVFVAEHADSIKKAAAVGAAASAAVVGTVIYMHHKGKNR